MAVAEVLLMPKITTMARKKYNFLVANKPYFTEQQFLTGAQIKAMADIPAEYQLYMTAPHMRDELIEDDRVVNFALPGVEKFDARKPHEGIEIIVNGSLIPYNSPTISYEKLGEIVYGTNNIAGNRGYTVVYKDGPDQNPEGVLSKGNEVFVKHKMKFDVTRTHLS